MRSRITSKFRPWKVGDKVWLDNKNLRLHYPSRKLSPKREGPFEISQVLSPVSYRLRLPPTWKIHNVFHASLLSSYRETPKHGPNFLTLPPEVIDGEEEYEVVEILAHRGSVRRRQYLINWKGYSSAENTWEYASNLTHADSLLSKYKLRNKI